jgi:hypothetical protein
MSLDFDVLMANIRAQVHQYIEHVLVECCKEYNLPFQDVRDRIFQSKCLDSNIPNIGIEDQSEVTSKPVKNEPNNKSKSKKASPKPEEEPDSNKSKSKKASPKPEEEPDSNNSINGPVAHEEPSKKKIQSAKNNKPVQMCTAHTKNGDPCRSKAFGTELFCKKHLKQPVIEKKPSKSKKVEEVKSPQVEVHDLPQDEATWFSESVDENTVGTMAPDLSMTKSFYPDAEIYDDESIIDDVSESEYVLDE